MSSDMLGAPFKAGGALYGAQMEAGSLDQQASMQRQNAVLARQKGAYDANRQSIVASQKIGAATAAYGASGVTSDSGSVLDVLGMSAANAERDRLSIIHGSDIRAINFENQAVLDEYGAKSTLQAGYYNALTSLVGVGANSYAKSPGKNDSKVTEGDEEDMTAKGEGAAVAADPSGGSGGMDWNYGSSTPLF